MKCAEKSLVSDLFDAEFAGKWRLVLLVARREVENKYGVHDERTAVEVVDGLDSRGSIVRGFSSESRVSYTLLL